MPLTRRQFLTLTAAAALLPALPAQALARRPDHLFRWHGGGPFFGGFSGIDVSADRSRALFVSDRGFGVRARLIRDAAGQIVDIEKLDHFRLTGTDGAALRGRHSDSEGIDLRPDGSFYVSFEGPGGGRIHHYRDPQGPATALPRAPGWDALPGNESLEALAVDDRGAVYTLPEGQQNGAHPLYRFTDRWEVIAQVPSRNGFLPVGMDFGPDGNLYLLERKFRLAFFATRISRITPGFWEQPETLVQTRLGLMDNHEGISVTRDERGQLWATTVSDDNRHMLQRTEIAEFRLP